MHSRTCSIDGCSQPHRARGWCYKHWYRWRRHGDPRMTLVTCHEGDAVERFWAKVVKTEACWNWAGAVTAAGYGSYRVGSRIIGAHRFAYEIAVGAIPDELEIDHRCHNLRCVNPSHLRVVTRKQNCENRPKARSDSKSGIRGVSWDAKQQLWHAQVFHLGRRVYDQHFKTGDEAAAAVAAARNQFFTHNDVDRMCVKAE